MGVWGVWLDDYSDELATDPLRRRLMALVDVVPDAACDEIFPYQFPAKLMVRSADREETFEMLTNRGEPQWPLTDEELAQKFLANSQGRLSPETAAQVSSLALQLTEQESVRPLMALVGGA